MHDVQYRLGSLRHLHFVEIVPCVAPNLVPVHRLVPLLRAAREDGVARRDRVSRAAARRHPVNNYYTAR